MVDPGGYHQSSTMPKRVHAPRSQIPVAGVDPFESMESRRRRLFPQSVQPTPAELPGSSSSDHAHQVPDAARSTPTVERNPNWADAPVRHTSRRGSRAKAAAAIRDADPDAFSLPELRLWNRHSDDFKSEAKAFDLGIATTTISRAKQFDLGIVITTIPKRKQPDFGIVIPTISKRERRSIARRIARSIRGSIARTLRP